MGLLAWLRSRRGDESTRAEMLASMRQNNEAPDGTGDRLVDAVGEIQRAGRFGEPGRSLEAEFKPPRDY